MSGPDGQPALVATLPEPQGVSAHSCDGQAQGRECHGLDTPERVCFYEQDFYVLSNFSAFQVALRGSSEPFMTSEHAYHWCRFRPFLYDFEMSQDDVDLIPSWRLSATEQLAEGVRVASSAHGAFRLAQDGKEFQRPDWSAIKVDVMRMILRAKASQHEYVRRKLLATGDRELVENSWRDDFWGWGPNRDGQNMLGKLWMELRTEFRAAQQARSQ